MPYSVSSYSDIGGSPFQQYQNQQQQFALQQQQLQNQKLQLQQQNPQWMGQQQYGQLPQYNFNQNQAPAGQNFSRGIPETGSLWNQGAVTGPMKSPTQPTQPTQPQPNQQNLFQAQSQQYFPLQPYSYGQQSQYSDPAGGTMTSGYMPFQYF